MNHFTVLPISVLGNSHNLIESSKNELEMHHRWYVVMWLAGSSPVLPSNFRMFVGILTGTSGQEKWFLMGSFVSFDRSGNSRGLPKMAVSLVQTGSGYSDYKDIGFRITQSHHEAFQNKVGSLVDTSPVGDFVLFGRRTVYIPPFGVGWCMMW